MAGIIGMDKVIKTVKKVCVSYNSQYKDEEQLNISLLNPSPLAETAPHKTVNMANTTWKDVDLFLLQPVHIHEGA